MNEINIGVWFLVGILLAVAIILAAYWFIGWKFAKAQDKAEKAAEERDDIGAKQ